MFRILGADLDDDALRDSLETREEWTNGVRRIVEDPGDQHMRAMERVHRRREVVGFENADELARGGRSPSREDGNPPRHAARLIHLVRERLERTVAPSKKRPLTAPWTFDAACIVPMTASGPFAAPAS